MKRILYIFLLLPFSLFAVNCTVVESVDGVHIRCWAEDDDQGNLTNVLTKSECENLKRDVGELLDQCVDLLRSASTSVDSLAHDEITPLINDLATLQSENGAITPPNEHTTNIAHTISLMDTRLNSAYNSLIGTAADLDSKASEVASMKSSLDSYQCSSANCVDTGGGSVGCPCQEEFNTLLRRVNEIYGVLTEISVSVASNTAAVVSISEQVSLIREFVESISDRLNAPDDRMWTELDDIYTSLSSNLSSVVYSSLNLSQIFYELKQLINGDSGNKLKLTTEGVISLYNSLFSMVNAVQNQHNFSAFDDSVRYFSNTVSRYYLLFNDLFSLSSSFDSAPPSGKYAQLYSAFTNDSLSARSRYRTLSSSYLGGVTNWFTRMELYHQAALGWFDDQSKTELEQEQDRTTESSIEDSFGQTTNRLGSVSSAGSDLTNSVLSVFSPVVDDLANAEVIASLPTRIMFIESIDLGSFGEIPDMYLETSQISEYCDLARKVSTLIWKVLIWGLYVVLAVGIGRVVFILVLYVIHFVQNL